MKILFLTDNYVETYASLEPFRLGLFSALAKKATSLLYLQANDYIDDIGEFRSSKYKRHVLGAIKNYNPDLVFSLNRAGLTVEVQSILKAPIVSWYIDNPNRFPKFLRHYASGETIYCATRFQMEWLKADAEGATVQIDYLPFCTNDALFRPNPKVPDDSKCDVSFVGTLWTPNHMIHLVDAWLKTNEDKLWFAETLKRYEEDYNYDAPQKIADRFHYLRGPTQLKNLLDDFLSSRSRLQVLSALSDLDLEVYGTQTWLGPALLQSKSLYQSISPEPLLAPEKLAALYQRSRVGLSIAHNQAQSGFPIRVFDILACGTPLATDRHSELGELFEEGSMFLAFSTPGEASEKVRSILKDKKLAAKMSQTAVKEVKNKHTFNKRVEQMFKAAGAVGNLGEVVVVSERFDGHGLAIQPALKNVPLKLERQSGQRPGPASSAVKAFRASRHGSDFLGLVTRVSFLAGKLFFAGPKERDLVWGLGRHTLIHYREELKELYSVLMMQSKKSDERS